MRTICKKFGALIFDCDGVILNSNRIKTDAFYSAALPYGPAAAQALVAYHTSRGGISRYEKFSHFLEEIVPALSPGVTGPTLDQLLVTYADAVHEGLMNCDITPKLADLRAATSGIPWLIVSGGDQLELRQIFAARRLDTMFDGGIFGSPDAKDAILARELAAGNIVKPALFLGDSRYDHIVARGAGLDFVFVSEWSEMPDWPDYLRRENIEHIKAVQDMLYNEVAGDN